MNVTLQLGTYLHKIVYTAWQLVHIKVSEYKPDDIVLIDVYQPKTVQVLIIVVRVIGRMDTALRGSKLSSTLCDTKIKKGINMLLLPN
jgi:hypothetical protein